MQIIPALNSLYSRYPKLRIDLRLSDQSVDLLREGIDVAFRVAALKDDRLIVRSLGQATRLTVAAPSYLQRMGAPEHPGDLSAHQCIYFSGIHLPRQWRYRHQGRKIDVPIQGGFEVNASDAVHQAALQGLGLALLPAWMLQPTLRPAACKRC